MTQEQMAEKYGMGINSIKYRLKRGIPLERPKQPGWGKGNAPRRRCGCAIKKKCECATIDGFNQAKDVPK